MYFFINLFFPSHFPTWLKTYWYLYLRVWSLNFLLVITYFSRPLPSSEPVRMMGNSGWNATAAIFWAWPSNVCTHVLFCVHNKEKTNKSSLILILRLKKTFDIQEEFILLIYSHNISMCSHLIIPNFYQSIICTRNQIWLIPPSIVVHTISTLLMTFQSKVGCWRAKLPNLKDF